MKKLAIALLFFAIPALAANAADMYFVKGVPAMHEAASVTDAKNAALAKAKSSAMAVVLARLLPAKTAAGVPMPPSAQLDKFTRQFKIEGERMGEKSYSADVSVQFDRTQVLSWLKEQGFSPLESEPPPMLLFVAPEYVETAEAEVANRAYTAVPNIKFKPASPNELGRAKAVPVLELQDDLAAASAGSAAVLDLSGSEGSYSVRLTDKSGGQSLAFTTKADLAETIRSALILAADFQKLSAAAGGGAENVMAVLYFSSFEEWLRKEKTLGAIADVKDVRLAAMKFDRVQLEIKYRYSVESLTAALGKAGFRVESRGNYLVMR